MHTVLSDIDVCFQLCGHQQHDFIHHLMQQVNPAQAHFSINFVSFLLNDLVHLSFVCLNIYNSFHLLHNSRHRDRLVLFLGHMLIERTPDSREHFLLQLPRLELHQFFYFLDTLAEVRDLLGYHTD